MTKKSKVLILILVLLIIVLIIAGVIYLNLPQQEVITVTRCAGDLETTSGSGCWEATAYNNVKSEQECNALGGYWEAPNFAGFYREADQQMYCFFVSGYTR